MTSEDRYPRTARSYSKQALRWVLRPVCAGLDLVSTAAMVQMAERDPLLSQTVGAPSPQLESRTVPPTAA